MNKVDEAKAWLKEANHNGWDGIGFTHMSNLIDALDSEINKRVSYEKANLPAS